MALPAARPGVRPALFVAAALTAYANTFDALALAQGREHFGLWRLVCNLAGVAALLGWGRRFAQLGPAELGLGRRGHLHPTGLGLLAGAALALPALVFLWLPRVPGGRLTYQPLSDSSPGDFLRRIAFEMPVATAICEEIAFRGVLQALVRRCFPPAHALWLTNLPFALWHITVNLNTLQRTSLPQRPPVRALGLAAGLLSVYAGGVVFSALRLWTGSLLAAISAHWAVDAVILAALFRRRRVPVAAVLATDVGEDLT